MTTNAFLLSQAQAFLRSVSDKRHPNKSLAKAWEDFFLIEDARLRRFARAFRVPPDWREDVIQGTWVEIVKVLRHADFNSVKHFHCWMRKVVRIKVAYVFRQLRRHSFASLDALELESGDGGGEYSAGRERAKRAYDLLLIWLEKLQQKDTISYQLMKGHYVEKREVQELVAETMLTAPQIYCRMHRLRETFRKWALRHWGAEVEAP